MLTQLLDLLEEGRAFSLEDLSRRLQTGEGAVKAQMEYLERLGLLRQVRSGGCGSCCACGRCGKSTPTGPAMWEKVSI